MKQCTKCKQTKSLDEFSWKNKAKGRRSSICKACHKIARDKHYQANKQRYKDNKQARIADIRQWYREYKSNLSCERCGEDHPATLQFHHVGDKDNAVSQMVLQGNSRDAIMKEISKCIVLCANCHAKEHWND